MEELLELNKNSKIVIKLTNLSTLRCSDLLTFVFLSVMQKECLCYIGYDSATFFALGFNKTGNLN